MSFNYTLPSLITAISSQMDANTLKAASGGLACEPDSVFIICNSFPRNAFALYEAIHGAGNASSFAALNTRWASAIAAYGVVPFRDQFFKLDYLLWPGVWEPIASSGSDAWALAWLAPWWPTSAPPVPQLAYSRMSTSGDWRTGEGLNASVPGAYLAVQSLGGRLFPFTSAVATSLWPLIEKQFYATSSPSRLTAVYSWLEASWGRVVCADNGSACADSPLYFLYDTRDDYAIFTSANALAGMLVPDASPDWLRSVFQTGSALTDNTVFYEALYSQPYLSFVPYPLVMVTSAAFDATNSTLVFRLTAGDPSPQRTANATVAYQPATYAPTLVQVNGSAWAGWAATGAGVLTILLPLATNGGLTEVAVLFRNV